MLKEVFAPHLNRNVKLGGRIIPVSYGPSLKLENYMRLGSMPVTPPSLDLGALAMACLIQVFMNNSLGDCVIAGKGHIDGVWTGNSNGGTPFIATEQQIVSQYSAIGGYVPGNSATDQGCNMQTAMNWWVANPGADGNKLMAWVAGNPTSSVSTAAAVNLTENGYIGMALPDAWISPFPSANGFVWDVAGNPNPSNGHCVEAHGFDSTGLIICSWGLIGHLTWAALAKYATNNNGGEFYHLLSSDILLKGQQTTPEGVALPQLIADWDSIGGHLVVPPSPAPAPTPVPPGTHPTKAQIVAAAVGALQTMSPFIPRASAEAAVRGAILKLFPTGP